MLGMCCLVIICQKCQMEFIFAQIIRLLAVTQPGKLQQMRSFAVRQIYQNKAAVSSLLAVFLLQSQGLFGIKRRKVSWFAVIFIALGSFAGTLLGTLIFPILGSLLGGMAGAFAAAFAYELARAGVSAAAMQLAWTAAKMRFFAIVGKLAAGIALSALLLKQVVFF